jgi:hypothetical protein
MFSTPLRISAMSGWAVTMTWLCCGAALGQSFNFTTIQYPGLAPAGDIRTSILAGAGMEPDGNRLAAR